jgi:hypothetical protein
MDMNPLKGMATAMVPFVNIRPFTLPMAVGQNGTPKRVNGLVGRRQGSH